MTDPTEIALWAAIGERPEDGLRRLVLADWYEEHAGTVECWCLNSEYRAGRITLTFGGVPLADAGLIGTFWCERCHGTDRVSDGRAEMAEALRATVGMVPQKKHGYWRWRRDGEGKAAAPFRVPVAVWAVLCGYQFVKYARRWARYHTAIAAISDLCLAWIAVRKGVTT